MRRDNKIILSHPTGNANVRALANGLAEGGLLYRFYTSFAVFPDSFLSKLAQINALKEIGRRTYAPLLEPYTKTYPKYELGRIIASRFGLSSLIAKEKGIFSVDSVYHNLDKKVSSKLSAAKKKGVTSVYNYEDGALETFRKAKEQGLRCIYELPIGYWQVAKETLGKESELRPEWASTMQGLNDSPAKLARKDEEIMLSDHIIVASSFTAKTLRAYNGNCPPTYTVPYGFPEVVTDRQYSPLNNRKLKLLFVGGLSQRKGIANVFEAADRLKDQIELTVVGRSTVSDCEILNSNLAKHKWYPSLPHKQVLELMRNQDILIFPSLFEGFGLVITEAMSQGTPVITTECTAGPDLITTGKDGWIIEAGSTDAIQHQLENILSNPSLLKDVSLRAIETASKRPWSVYQQEMKELLKTLV